MAVTDLNDDSNLALKNDFTYDGFTVPGKCPLSAQIRKVHIRQNGFDPGGTTCITRRGIHDCKDLDGGFDGGHGLLFAAYQSTIEQSGFDVTIGQRTTGDQFDMTTKKFVTISTVNHLVTPVGEEYFFGRSMKVLRAGLNLANLVKI